MTLNFEFCNRKVDKVLVIDLVRAISSVGDPGIGIAGDRPGDMGAVGPGLTGQEVATRRPALSAGRHLYQRLIVLADQPETHTAQRHHQKLHMLFAPA